MGLKLEVESLDGVAEAQRGLYVEKDGKFRLDVDGVDGLMGSLAKERNDHRTTKQKLQRYVIDGKELDPEQYQQALSELETLRAEKAAATAKADKTPQEDAKSKELAAKLEKLEKQLQTADAERQKTSQRLRTKVIERAIDLACEEQHVQRQFYGDARDKASRFTVLDDDETVVLANPDGTPYEDDGRHVPVGKWFETFVKDERPGWVAPSGGGGARGSSAASATRGGVIDRNDSASFLANLGDIAAGKRAVQ